MSERRPFQDIDEKDEPRTEEHDPSEVGPIVGGMGQMPGSGATGIAGAGMAPPVNAETTRDVDEDIREDSEAEEPADGRAE